MLHHIEIYVSDLERSIGFWTPFMALLGYKPDRWAQGMNYVKEGESYFCFLQAPLEHLSAGYHRKRVGLNHLALKGQSREHVHAIAAWVRSSGYVTLYDDRYPYAGGPSYYALFCEDPDRIKVEVVAPSQTRARHQFVPEGHRRASRLSSRNASGLAGHLHFSRRQCRKLLVWTSR